MLKKLNAAIAKLLRLTTRGQGPPALDYQSLMTLSNSSRMQALKTFDQLSHRLSSAKSSRSSVVPAATTAARASKPAKPVKTTRSSGGSSKASHSKSTSSPSSAAAAAAPGRDRDRDGRHKRDARPPARAHATNGSERRAGPDDGGRTGGQPAGAARTPAPTPPPPPAGPAGGGGTQGRISGTRSRPLSFMNRFSMATMSSDSTRLGEIPERKWHRRYDPMDGAVDEYNTPIVYPLRPYQAPAKERRFLGLFRRG